jgi:hypothetical protein
VGDFARHGWHAGVGFIYAISDYDLTTSDLDVVPPEPPDVDPKFENAFGIDARAGNRAFEHGASSSTTSGNPDATRATGSSALISRLIPTCAQLEHEAPRNDGSESTSSRAATDGRSRLPLRVEAGCSCVP